MYSDVPKRKCKICNKKFSSKQSLCNHNSRFHKPKVQDVGENVMVSKGNVMVNLVNVMVNTENFIKNSLKCEYCNKLFSTRQSKSEHIKNVCKKKINIINSNNTLKILELEKENEKLKNKLTNITTNNNINSNNNTTNNITNNNNKIIINLNINKPGDENLKDLTEEEIIQILLKNGDGITKFIELINFNKELPQNHSFCTTNLKSKYLDVYNNETKLITKDRKKFFFDKLLYNAVNNIQNLYNQNKSKKYIIDNDNEEFMRSSVVLGMKYFTDIIFHNRNLSNKILKELFNEFELLSYNNQNLIKNTWSGSSDTDSLNNLRQLKKLLNEIELFKLTDYEYKLKKLKYKNEKINTLFIKMKK